MMDEKSKVAVPEPGETMLAYHVLRYVPNLVRDEWVNIGVLVFNPQTGQRAVRLIEGLDEYNRVLRLHPWADEGLLRALRDDLQDRLEKGRGTNGNGGDAAFAWRNLLGKWEDTLSNALQIAPQKGLLGRDVETEVARLYADHVAIPSRRKSAAVQNSRSGMRHYCNDVFRQAGIWERIEKSVRIAEFTFPGDPARLDYAYRRNGTHGYVHTLSVTRSPQDAKTLSYNVKHIAEKAPFKSEFAAVTDVRLDKENERHRFVLGTLQEMGIEPVPREGLATWVAKLRPSLLQ